MDELSVLIIEDSPNWQNTLKSLFEELGKDLKIHSAINFQEAERVIETDSYDLVVLDLQLPHSTSKDELEISLTLLDKIRRDKNSHLPAIIVLTDHGKTSYARRAFRDYDVYDFLEKDDFKWEQFLQVVCSAILESRLKHAEERADSRCQVIINFSKDSLIGSEGRGPAFLVSNPVVPAEIFNESDFSRRGDNLNLLITKGGPEIWRLEAKSVGREIYSNLLNEKKLAETLYRAQEIVKRSKKDLWLRFNGPANILSVPFELIHDDTEYTSWNHVFIRGLTGYNVGNSAPFHVFIENLWKSGKLLNVLIVGSDSDGSIPSAELEARELKSAMDTALRHLGLKHQITCLTAQDASYERVVQELKSGRYHIFHYSGHGRFGDKLAEISGLVLSDESGDYKTLTAVELNFIIRNSQLQFVYLSCCLSARTASDLGRGDFHGIFEALARADVPTILGYRWTVLDDSALQLAKVFYQSLWRTLSPGEALYHARQAIVLQKGLDDETWASPVLLMQNP